MKKIVYNKGGNLWPAWTFDMAALEFSLPKLEYNMVSKRSSMISRYLESRPKEVTLPHSYTKLEI